MIYRTAATLCGPPPIDVEPTVGDTVRVKDPQSFLARVDALVGRVVFAEAGNFLVRIKGVEWLFARSEIERVTR